MSDSLLNSADLRCSYMLVPERGSRDAVLLLILSKLLFYTNKDPFFSHSFSHTVTTVCFPISFLTFDFKKTNVCALNPAPPSPSSKLSLLCLQ